MLKNTLVSLCGLCLMAAASHAAEPTYYSWVDDNGVVNYSEIAPLDRDYQVLSGSKPPQQFGYPARKKEQPAPVKTEVATNTDDPNEIIRGQNCRFAQEAMEKLTGFEQIILKDEDGIWREASEEMKQSEITKAQQAISENCN